MHTVSLVLITVHFFTCTLSVNLEWGTYRPNVYFGVRAKHPQSPLVGFMWYDGGKYEGIGQMRHECSDNDQLSTYGWHRHNGNDFGQQIFYDPLTNLQLTTSFVKFEYNYTNKENSNEIIEDEGWIAFFEGANIPRGPNIASGVLSTIWYITTGENTTIDNEPKISVKNENSVFGSDGKSSKYYESEFIQLIGEISDISYNFTLVSILDKDNLYGVAIRPTKKNKLKTQQMKKRTYISGVRMNHENKWRGKEIAQTLLQKQARKLYKRTKTIIENDFPDQERQQQIISQLSPNLKHGILKSHENDETSDTSGASDDPNVYLFQNYLLNPFRMHLVFLPHSSDLDITSWDDLPESINDREKIRKLIESKVNRFDSEFEDSFNVVYKKPLLYENKTVKTDTSDMTDEEVEYFNLKYDNSTNKKYVSIGEYRVARYGISNMLGGIGYWYGDQIFKLPQNSEPTNTDPMTLYSAVPSRSFFPRGFLWDEGFHNQLILLWNVDISLEILSSWLNNMDENGWIAREQILGEEARSRVPKKFQIQKPHIANPPTMFLAIYGLYNYYVTRNVYNTPENPFEKLLNSDCNDLLTVTSEVSADGTTETSEEAKMNATKNYEACLAKKEEISKNEEKIRKFLSENYDRLKLHFEWYISTQLSPLADNKDNPNKDLFRWRGRTPNHNLPSGLDDYPRFVNITDYEGHVDIQCWMIKLYEIMAKFAEFENKLDESKEYLKQKDLLYNRLVSDFWDSSVNAFQDFAYMKEEDYKIKHFANHIGYVSSFPLFLQILPVNSEYLPYILDQLSNNETGIWSDYGLRSLSASDANYGTEEDYWRGAIWINLNYLAVKSLRHYQIEYEKVSKDGTFVNEELKSKIDNLYNDLKTNLINNIFREFSKFGFMYENYNSETGYGQRSKPFTGWTALICNIIAELYP